MNKNNKTHACAVAVDAANNAKMFAAANAAAKFWIAAGAAAWVDANGNPVNVKA